MNKIPFTYCLVKYVHSPAIGEMLNIGVFICAPSVSYIEAKFNYHYERLSQTFVNFDGEHYREIIKDIESSLSKIKDLNSSSTLFVINERVETAEQLVNQIMPDRSLSIQFGAMMAGLAYDIEEELEYIFQQMVLSQYPHREKKSRDDEEVWAYYRKPLHQKQIDKYLQPKHFTSDNLPDVKFEHTFKNEKHHVLDPITMDYAKASDIPNKANKVLGQAITLEGHPEIGKLYLLLGAPRNPSHRNAYIKAKNLLHKIPIDKEIIEENEAEDFADQLADYMERHGVFNSE